MLDNLESVVGLFRLNKAPTYILTNTVKDATLTEYVTMRISAELIRKNEVGVSHMVSVP